MEKKNAQIKDLEVIISEIQDIFIELVQDSE